MTRRALIVVFVLTLLVLLTATLPLRRVITMAAGDTFDRMELSAIEASGTAWSGRLRTVDWLGAPQGDVAVALRPLSLLTGTRRLHLATSGFSVDLMQGRSYGFENASGRLELPIRRPLATMMQLSLADASLVFIDGRCQEARGTVTVQLTHMPGSPLRLEGSVRCEDGRGRLALATVGPANLPVEADLVIDAHGGIELDSRIRPPDETSSLSLQAAGFQPTPEGLVRTDSWRLAD